jgi:hypothetical protein
MLAAGPSQPDPIGKLSKDVHQPGTFINELLNLIEGELAVWRDRPERKPETAETSLTSQLCAHMNSVTRRAHGWDVLQFRIEEPDEAVVGRKVDLIAAPANATIWVDGRKYEDFDPLLPIECKRLPTPAQGERDEREYVFSEKSTTGGIQRFKLGLHGAVHKVGGMIGYVQQDTCAIWSGRVAEWIRRLVADGELGWSAADTPNLVHNDAATRVARLESLHARKEGMAQISLRHLWIQMN